MNCKLAIYDNTDIDRFEQFENIISKTVREYKNTIVILDALYNLPQSQSFDFGREAHQERARALKQVVNRYSIPLIASSELRKPARSSENSKPTMHDLPEARDYAYNADLVWLLYYNTSVYKTYDEFKKSDNPLLTLDFDKNKISSYRGTVNLRFNRFDTTMEEVEEVDCVEQTIFDIILR
jgi:replicative DNA helicase